MQAPTTTELAELVGTPFVYGGRGPDAFDCYGLLMHLHALRGVALPDYRSPTDQATISALLASQLPLWERCPSAPGAAVAFRIGRLVTHCGMVLDDDHFIHTWEGSGGVCIERLSDWKDRIYGFYRYAG